MALPAGSRALRPLLLAGDLLADRYRLVRPVPAATPGQAGPADLWLAQDEVLDRAVAAKILSAGGRRGAAASRAFLGAAAAASAISHPVLARVYDAALEQRPAERAGRPAGEIDVAYVISEWVDGPTLAALLAADGPWQPAQACALVTDVADALLAAHAAGFAHGRVHPGNLLFPLGGGVKVTDLAVSAALPGRAVPAGRATDPDPVAADVRDLAAVLYAVLTARWPTSATPQPAGGLPAAPAGKDGASRGRLTSPGQVRAGVPHALNNVVVRALDPTRAQLAPALTTAAGLCDALERTVPADASVRIAPPAPRIPAGLRRRLPLLSVLAVLTVIGAGSYTVGREIGTVPTPDDTVAVGTPGADGAIAAGTPIDLTSVPIRDFDPPPGDGRERPGAVPNAHDDDPSTVWETERYESDTFGGIKQGVGLLVDLGAPTPVSGVELSMTASGAVVELRAADAPAEQADGYRVLTSGRSESGPLVLTPPAETQARFYLIWITGLPPVDGRFSVGIAELRFLRG